LLDDETKARADNAWMATCKESYAFCCWDVTKKGGQNSQICPIIKRSLVHCHGVTIPDDRQSQAFYDAQSALNHVQIHDHLQKRGYYQRIAGTQSCDCGEKMAKFVRSDASKPVGADRASVGGFLYLDPSIDSNFQAAGGNDLNTACKQVGKPATVNIQNMCH
jgi:hypothetical protein